MMFRKMKDLLKDLPNQLAGDTSPSPPQQQQPQQQLHGSTSTTTTTTSSSSPHTPSPPPSRNYSGNDLHQQQGQQQQHVHSLLQTLPPAPQVNTWQLFPGNEVTSLQPKPLQPARLKAFWAEFLSSKSDKDKVARLNRLLPYFIGLHEERRIDVRNMNDVFGTNSKSFAFAVSRRLVKDLQELSKTMTSQPRDTHARELYKYLSTSGSNVCGFDLLYTLEILSEASVSCEAMSEASVPSTLARSLQLLFLVPANILDQTRGIVEDKIIRTLCHLAHQKHAIEELQKSDTLSIIFSLMTAECPTTHRLFRSKIISFGADLSDLLSPTITYINSKKIISHLIQDINNNFNNIGYSKEMIISVTQMIIKILSESAKKSAILLEDFQRNEGYGFLLTALTNLEPSCKEKPHLFDQLLDSITSLVYVGYGTITLPESSPVPYQSSITHSLKEISSQHSIVKNESVLVLFEHYFLNSKMDENRLKVLDKILSIYSSNPANFILLQHLKTLTTFIQSFEKFSNNLKYHVMKIVCFVVTVLNVVPFQELSTFSLLVNENPSVYTLEMIYQLITTLINFEFRYKHIFREAGLLDILIKVIGHLSQQTIDNHRQLQKEGKNQQQDNSTDISHQTFPILLDSIYLLISEHPDNINIVRKYGFFDTLLSIIPFSFVRLRALRILQQLIKYDNDTTQKEFDGLVKMLTSTPKDAYHLKTDIFNSIKKLFSISKFSRDSFREHGGFVSIISVLIGMESSFKSWEEEKIEKKKKKQMLALEGESQSTEEEEEKSSFMKDQEEEEIIINGKEMKQDERLDLLEAICRTTTSALCGNQQNRASFEQQIGYSTFATGLVMTGVLNTSKALRVVDFIFDMVTENLNGSDAISNRMIINNVEAFHVILGIIPFINNQNYVLDIIRRLNMMAEYGRYNQEALSKLSIPDWILTKFPTSLSNVDDPLQPHLLTLIQTVGANCLSGSELRRFVRLLQPDHSPEVLLKILCSMAQSPAAPPYFEFNLSKIPYGYVHLPIGSTRNWPPTNGYSMLFWLYVERGVYNQQAAGASAAQQQQIDLVNVYSEDRKSQLSIFIKNGHLTIHIYNNSKYVIEYTQFKFEEGRWYHIGIVHARRLLSGTDFKIFIDGFLRYTAAKAQYPAQASNLTVDLGASNPSRFQSDQIWRIGPFYLMEEALSSKHINTIYFLGPNYCSNFRGRFSPYQTYEIINNQNLTAIKELDYGDQLGPLNLAKVSMQIDESRIIAGLCANNRREVKIKDRDHVSAGLPPHIDNIIATSGSSSGKDSTSSYQHGNSMGSGKDGEIRIEIVNQADLSGKTRGQLIASVEAFRRNKVADGIRKIGGMPIALLLLDKAADEESLFDAFGLLVGLIQNHPTNTHEMSIINGYELAAWVLQSKTSYVSKRIIDLIFNLVGINGNISQKQGDDQQRQPIRKEGTVANWNACKYIMMQYDLWKNTDIDLQRYILQGFNDLIVDNYQKEFNCDSLRKVHIVQEMFDILQDETVSEEIVPAVVGVLYNVFSVRLVEDDIRLVSAFLIAGLNSHQRRSNRLSRAASNRLSTSRSTDSRINRTCNRIFQMFLHVVCTTKDTSVIYKRVSSFWSFFFISEQYPPLSVSLALKVSSSFFLIRYEYCQSFIKKSGFRLLEKILPSLCAYQEIYVTLFHLLLGSNPQALTASACGPADDQNANTVFTTLEFHELLNIFKTVEKNVYCIEAAQLILAMVKKSYEDNYQHLASYRELQLQQQQSSNSGDLGVDESVSIFSPVLVPSLPNVSPLSTNSSSSSPSASPLSISQSMAPPKNDNNTSTTTSSTATANSASTPSTATNPSSNQSTPTSNTMLSRMGSFLSKVEEKTLELVELSSEGVQSTKKKRASISTSPAHLNNSFKQMSIAAGGNTNTGNSNMTQSELSSSMASGISSSSSMMEPSLLNASSLLVTSSEVGLVAQLTPIQSPDAASNLQHTILTYFMYLFHENPQFQQEWYAIGMIESLISILFPNGHIHLPNVSMNTLHESATYKEQQQQSQSSSQSSQQPQQPTSTFIVKRDRVLDLALKFLCQIVLSALRKSPKAITITEYILDSVPLTVPDDEYLTYHTHILADLLYTFETNITKSEFFDSERIHSTLVKFTAMLVDRLHVEVFRPSLQRRVLLFLVKILEKLEADRPGLKHVSPLYRQLNRVILLIVNNAQSEQQEFLYLVNHILNHQRIVFSENNNDSEFFASICFPLFKLSVVQPQMESLNIGQDVSDTAAKLFKLLMSNRIPSESINPLLVYRPSGSTKTELADLRPGFELLARGSIQTDFRPWIQENLLIVNLVFEEGPKRAHQNHLSSERRNSAETLQSIKLRRKDRIARNEKIERKTATHDEERQQHTTKKIQYFVRTEAERKKKIRSLEIDKQRFNAKQFEQIREQVTRERAVWGPATPSTLDKWKLDSTEGPYRMRKKTEKNYDFYKNYPYVPPSFDELGGNNLLPLPSSGDSEAFIKSLSENSDVANSLEPAYWKFTTSDGSTVGGQYIVESTTTNNNNNNNNNNSSSAITTANTATTSTPANRVRSSSVPVKVSTPVKSTDDMSSNASGSPVALNRSSSTDITPPASPLHSSAEDSMSIQPQDQSMDQSIDQSMDQSMDQIDLNEQSTHSNNANNSIFALNENDKEANTTGASTPTSQQGALKTSNEIDEDSPATAEESEANNEEENHAYTRLLDPFDQSYLREEMRRNYRLISVIYNCGSVDGMDKTEGILMFCPINMYIFDGYQKDDNTGDISEVEEKINTDWLTEGQVVQKKMVSHNCLKWGYEEVREVLKRRYLLRPVAIELFSTDGRNTLITFKDETTRDEVYYKIITNVSNNSIGDISGISGGQTGVDEEYGGNVGVKEKFTSMWRKSPLTLKWQQGQISNFQYLMHLNTLAGRSYNDLTQYPVFPWILKDFTSEELDLDDISVYRDLSRPMGALDETRAEKFRDRFENWDDTEPNEHGHRVPKFHYGTHYSSAAIVLYYLIRLEPFTQHFLKLQGGRWDQPDRLFSSISETWVSSSSGSTGSIMELIPEFYYLPEFLENTNKFNFGFKQGGEPINDVVLPPWAKGSAQEFIKLHRRALESDYVSEHLHEWIDLIFGYKQQGKPAEDALNVYYYLTYEGAVNIDAITDPVEKAATIAQINNFGQTPKQLFDKPHPKRNPALSSFPFYAKSLNGNFIKDINEPVGQMRLINDRCTAVPFNKHLLAPTFQKYILWGLPDGSIRYHTGDKMKALEDHHDGPLTVLTTTDDGLICVSGGVDSMVCVFNLKRFSLSKRLCGHTGIITALAASRPYSVIVSGSEDHTAIIWDLNRLRYVRTLQGHDGPISCIAVHDTTGDIVTCSGTTINVYTINGEMMLTLKTSQIIYDQITTCYWSKGAEWLGENVLITGHRDGKIKVWGLESRLLPSIDSEPLSKLIFKNVLILRSTFYNPQSHSTAITSIYLTNDQQKLYTGDIEGKICLWSDTDSSAVKQRGWTLNPTDLRTMLPTGGGGTGTKFH